jgi:hypothetical protein
MLRRFSAGDYFFGATVLVLTVLAGRVWWLSAIVPGMDYPQFLVFVRVLQDHANPTSPFHGTYTVAQWFVPTSLPINLVSWLSYPLGHSIERAGKVLLTAQTVGLVAASVYLLRVLERPRWAVLFLFPIIFSSWTVVGGFAAYATSLPLMMLVWALTVRWFERLDVRFGLALALCLCAVLLWHGIGFVTCGIGFGALWLIWRAPSVSDWFKGLLPTLPCLAQCSAWLSTTFGTRHESVSPYWQSMGEAWDALFDHISPWVPHNSARTIALAIVVGAGLVSCGRNLLPRKQATRMWRVENPFLVVSLVYLAAYFAFPNSTSRVAGIASRFTYPAVLAFMFAWNLPSRATPRRLVLAAVLALGVWSVEDIADRFKAFGEETQGASALIDRLGPHETLYYAPPGEGASKAFGGAGNKPMRELEQYATIRNGGLPNSSFAGYGVNYIGYAGDHNPMPGFRGPPAWVRGMTRFDYVLAQTGHGPSDSHFKLIESREGWDLYGVCGSEKFPACP